ncbi:MAG: cytochrome c oxidase subunit II [Chloroflexi bacterium]|nr:MAG: cytochrome c oxidase subunit II [Chloroflexota bacterium]
MFRTTPTRLASVLALTVVALMASGCASMIPGLYPPTPVTAQGHDIGNLYDIVFLIAAAIFFVVEGFIIYAVIRYRRRPTDTELPPQIHGNNLVEIIWTVIPTVIVAYLFVVSWQTLNTVEATSQNPQVHVVAIARRFSWSFEYLGPDGKSLVNGPDGKAVELPGTMVVPAGQTVRLSLHSPDVIHAFYVPQFLFKRDVVPGHENTFDFTVDATDAGQTFRGQCAELCGVGHQGMSFEVQAKTPAEFDTWLQQQITQAKAVPSPPPSGKAPSGSPGASPSAPPAAVSLDLTAKNVAFDKTSLEAPANQPFDIKFTNDDQGTQHNVDIHKDSPTGQVVFDGEVITGPDTRLYQVTPLPAGTYAFVCKVHPTTMIGTLTVK